MQTNWSVMVNALLLVVVLGAMIFMIKGRRKSDYDRVQSPSLGTMEAARDDDIIAVRRIDEDKAAKPVMRETSEEIESAGTRPLMLFLSAKADRQFAGYELLQTLLAAGLRFGEGHLFHRHQHPNGQGPVLCSLAAATESGVFDLQNIGAFSVRGLCLFMQASGNPTIDAERLSIMLDTAGQLSEGLDAYLLDERKVLLSDAGIQRYYERLNLAVDYEGSA